MSDFDEYFTDDIVFDEQTLAVLDYEEQKYQTQQPLPPIKLRKIDDGSGVTSKSNPVEDTEDLPEISLQSDGTYGIRTTMKEAPKLTNQTTIQKARPFSAAAQRLQKQQSTPRVASSSRFQHTVPKPTAGYQTKPTSNQQVTMLGHISSARPPNKDISNSSLPQFSSHELPGRGLYNPPHDLQNQLEQLQAKLEQVDIFAYYFKYLLPLKMFR